MQPQTGKRSLKLLRSRPHSQELQRISELLKKGYLAEAQQFCKAAVARTPNEAELRYLFSLVELQRGNLDVAITQAEAALKLSPSTPRYELLIGVILMSLGSFNEAKAHLLRALGDSTIVADVLYNLGVVAQHQALHQEACDFFRNTTLLKSSMPEAWNNLGISLHALHRLNDACDAFDKAIALRPMYSDALNNKAILLVKMGQFDEAVALCEQAFNECPDALTAFNLGTFQQNANRFLEAHRWFSSALQIDPRYTKALNNRGLCLQALGEPDGALADFDAALAIDPKFVDATNNRGNVLRQLGKIESALLSYSRAIELDPFDPKPLNNRSIVKIQLLRLNEAIQDLDRAIALDPNYAEAYWHKSLVHLLLGDWDQGWSLYEWRWQRKTTIPLEKVLAQRWDGQAPIRGRSILVQAEQGFGDTIQFSRFTITLSTMGARVILKAPSSLTKILASISGVSEVVAQGEMVSEVDFYMPIMSLPLALKLRPTTLSPAHRYLSADNTSVQFWRNRLSHCRAPKVGLVWSGFRGHPDDAQRSIALNQFINVLPDGFDYISLQNEIRNTDQEALKKSSILCFADELVDFNATAGLIEQVDIVISVDTSVAHLAAALGKRTWILLPFSPDWRWGLQGESCVWYSSVRLFRQEFRGCWVKPLANIREKLIEYQSNLSASSIFMPMN